MTARYATYAAPPPDDALWSFGSEMIGYDAASARDIIFPEGDPCDAADWLALTEDPRRYGFHGTLKAPFELAEEASEADLLEAIMVFADRRPAVTVPELTVAALGSFVALVPAESNGALMALAADCVRIFDPFRAPMSAADRARRLKSPLTERQVGHLDDWGYPYVFEDFRYHMTLTGSLPAERREPIRAALARRYAAIAEPFRLDALVVFRQERRDQRFTILGRFACGG
jgi:putative phosphonate metabolism protein